MLHAIALNQQGFGHQRRQRVVFKQGYREIAQVFQAVAMENHESWLLSVRHKGVRFTACWRCENYPLSAGSSDELVLKKPGLIYKNRVRTLWNSSADTGLMRKSCMPAFCAMARSSSKTWAVMATMGVIFKASIISMRLIS